MFHVCVATCVVFMFEHVFNVCKHNTCSDTYMNVLCLCSNMCLMLCVHLVMCYVWVYLCVMCGFSYVLCVGLCFVVCVLYI